MKQEEKKNHKIAKNKDFEKIIKLLKNKNSKAIFSGEILKGILEKEKISCGDGYGKWRRVFNLEIIEDSKDCDYFYYDIDSCKKDGSGWYSRVEPLRVIGDLWRKFLSDMLNLGYVRVAKEDDFREIFNYFKRYKTTINSRVDIAGYIKKMLVKGIEVTRIINVLQNNKDCDYFYMNMGNRKKKDYLENPKYACNIPKTIESLRDLFDKMPQEMKAMGWVESD